MNIDTIISDSNTRTTTLNGGGTDLALPPQFDRMTVFVLAGCVVLRVEAVMGEFMRRQPDCLIHEMNAALDNDRIYRELSRLNLAFISGLVPVKNADRAVKMTLSDAFLVKECFGIVSRLTEGDLVKLKAECVGHPGVRITNSRPDAPELTLADFAAGHAYTSELFRLASAISQNSL